MQTARRNGILISHKGNNSFLRRNSMTTATYRGVSYNVEEHKINLLAMIKEQLEKEQRRKEAQMSLIKK